MAESPNYSCIKPHKRLVDILGDGVIGVVALVLTWTIPLYRYDIMIRRVT